MSDKYAFGKTNIVGQMAESTVRAESDVNQPAHVEVEAPIMAILQTQAARINNILDDTRESIRELYSKRMKEEIYAEYEKAAAAHKEEVRADLIQKLTPEIKASLKAQYAIQAKDEAAAETSRLRAALKAQIEFRLIEELRPDVVAKLRVELTEPVKEELRQELTAKRQNDEYDDNEEHRYRQQGQYHRDGHYDDHSEYQDEEHRIRHQDQHSCDGHRDDHSEHQDDEYDDKEEHQNRQQDQRSRDGHRDNRSGYQEDEYDDKEHHQNPQQDQHNRDCHREDHSRSPEQLNRDGQPLDYPSLSNHNEDLSFPGKQVNEEQQEAPPSFAFQGVKRSRLEQEYDEDDFWGRSPKRARISGYRAGEEELNIFGDGVEEEASSSNGSEEENDDNCDTTDHVSEAQEDKENIPPSSAYQGIKRSRFEEESEEEDVWGRSPKRMRLSSYGEEEEEEEDEWSGNRTEEEEGAKWDDDAAELEEEMKGSNTHGSSKENPIDLVDSDSENEAILEPAARWDPFLDVSNDQGYAPRQALPPDMLSRLPARMGQYAHAESDGTENFP